MTTKWQEKNVGVSLRRGSAERKPVINEDTGEVGGYHIEHWDDHQDAVVTPRGFTVKARAQAGEE